MTRNKEQIEEWIEKTERPVYVCLSYRGSGPGCDKCKVFTNGFCSDWCESVPRLKSFLLKRHSWLDLEAIELILDDTFTGVRKGIDAFLGESTFYSWVYSTCNNKRIDYGRTALKNNPYEELPFIPVELKQLCLEYNGHLNFYQTSKIGTLQVISATLSVEIEKDLLSLSKRPSWKITLQRLKNKKTRNIYNKNLAKGISSVCERYPKNILFKKCDPSGKLYAVAPPLQSHIQVKLLALSDRKDWQDAINRLRDSTSFDIWQETSLVPFGDEQNDKREDLEPVASFDEKSFLDSRILALEDQQFIDRLILLLEKLDVNCAKLFRDLIHIESQGETLKDLSRRYGVPANTLTKRKRRCIARIQFYPNELRLILPGDTVAIDEIINKKTNGYIWGKIDGGSELRSRKKLKPHDIDLLLNVFDRQGYAMVEIAGQRLGKNGNSFFFTFDVLETGM